MTVRCTSCARIFDNGVPRVRAAIARWTHANGAVDYVCQTTLDYWFDNADDDPELEPAAIEWLVVTPENTTVQDELAVALGASILAGLDPNRIAWLLLRTGWQTPPLASLRGMPLLRDRT